MSSITSTIEFGDDLNHLLNEFNQRHNTINAQTNFQRKMVFRSSIMLNAMEDIISQLIYTIDTLTIISLTLANSIIYALGHEKFGWLSKHGAEIANLGTTMITKYKKTYNSYTDLLKLKKVCSSL